MRGRWGVWWDDEATIHHYHAQLCVVTCKNAEFVVITRQAAIIITPNFAWSHAQMLKSLVRWWGKQPPLSRPTLHGHMRECWGACCDYEATIYFYHAQLCMATCETTEELGETMRQASTIIAPNFAWSHAQKLRSLQVLSGLKIAVRQRWANGIRACISTPN